MEKCSPQGVKIFSTSNTETPQKTQQTTIFCCALLLFPLFKCTATSILSLKLKMSEVNDNYLSRNHAGH